jgi:hypothetical protein
VSEVKVEKEEIVTFTVKLSKDRARHIEEWLTWAYYVWVQLDQDPQKYNEVLENMTPTALERIPGLKRLNYDTLIMVRNGLLK